MKKRANQPDPWTLSDTAMWQTIHIAADLEARVIPSYRVATMFALRQQELAFARGTHQRDRYDSIGDGSYTTSGFFVGGTGAIGVGLAVGSVAGNLIGNASRRARAASDATRMWRPGARGELVVTSQGFYLLEDGALYPWTWESIQSMEMTSRGSVVLQGQSENGPITWRIGSDWSELVFVLWASYRHPSHPQLVSRTWIPAGWSEWSTDRGYPPHPLAIR